MMMKTILCYGDSNTWGYAAEKFDTTTLQIERYPRNVRWTGRLQMLLGQDYYVVEEGLSGRTTNVDAIDPPDRNGARYLPPCLYTHAPIDLVILMLGINDLKNNYHRSAEDVANGLKELITIIQSTKYGPQLNTAPAILLIGYPEVSTDTGGALYGNQDLFKNGIARSQQFASLFEKLAKEKNCHYFNAAPYIHLNERDGLHFDEECHRIFADLMVKEVKKIL